MNSLLRYTKCRFATDRWTVIAWVAMVVLVIPALYAIGMANQPELFSYVADGLFYGTLYYNFGLAHSMAGSAVIAWTWLCSVQALSRYRNRRSGLFYAMLPVDWGAKFGYEALKSLVVVPGLLCAALMANHAIWYHVLVDQPVEWATVVPWGILTLALWFNALFFMIGAVARRNAGVWCVAVLVVVAGVLYAGETYEWEVLKSYTQPDRLSQGVYVLLWGSIAVFVGVAARATRRLEID